MSKKILAGIAMAAGLALAGAAQANVAYFDFTKFDSSSALAGGDFGHVVVTENAGGLDFVVSPTAPYRIHDGNDNHNAFAFELNGDPAITISNLTAGFARVAGTNFDAPPFDNNIWDYAIDCTTACGSGYGGGYAGNLTFTVKRTDAAPLLLTALGFNTVSSQNIYFTTDVVQLNGKTGNVGAVGGSGPPPPPPGVPEPATWAMMLLGFGGMGALLRRRQARTAVA